MNQLEPSDRSDLVHISVWWSSIPSQDRVRDHQEYSKGRSSIWSAEKYPTVRGMSAWKQMPIRFRNFVDTWQIPWSVPERSMQCREFCLTTICMVRCFLTYRLTLIGCWYSTADIRILGSSAVVKPPSHYSRNIAEYRELRSSLPAKVILRSCESLFCGWGFQSYWILHNSQRLSLLRSIGADWPSTLSSLVITAFSNIIRRRPTSIFCTTSLRLDDSLKGTQILEFWGHVEFLGRIAFDAKESKRWIKSSHPPSYDR